MADTRSRAQPTQLHPVHDNGKMSQTERTLLPTYLLRAEELQRYLSDLFSSEKIVIMVKWARNPAPCGRCVYGLTLE